MSGWGWRRPWIWGQPGYIASSRLAWLVLENGIKSCQQPHLMGWREKWNKKHTPFVHKSHSLIFLGDFHKNLKPCLSLARSVSSDSSAFPTKQKQRSTVSDINILCLSCSFWNVKCCVPISLESCGSRPSPVQEGQRGLFCHPPRNRLWALSGYVAFVSRW